MSYTKFLRYCAWQDANPDKTAADYDEELYGPFPPPPTSGREVRYLEVHGPDCTRLCLHLWREAGDEVKLILSASSGSRISKSPVLTLGIADLEKLAAQIAEPWPEQAPAVSDEKPE